MKIILTFNEKELQKKINEAVIRKLDNRVDIRTIEETIKNSVEDYISSSSEWQSLSSATPGSLAADFGFKPEDIPSKLNTILHYWIKSIKVKKTIETRARTSVFRLRVYGIKADFSDTITLKEAITVNFKRDGKTTKMQKLPWLEWLVLKGDATVIDDYHVEYGSYPRSQSRSGVAIMSEGSSFSVNPSFSGIKGNNFVTRAIEQLYASNEIHDLINKQILQALKTKSFGR